MAYPLSAPIDISDENPVLVTLTNTNSVGGVVWNMKTDGTDNLILGTNTPTTQDILIVKPSSLSDPDGVIEVPKINMLNGANKISIQADLALASDYNLTLPDVGPIGNQVMVVGSTSKFSDIHAKNTVIVRGNPGPGEFSSIEAAIASIPVFPAPNYPQYGNAWVVKIAPGTYLENTLVVPPYVFLNGETMDSVNISQNNTGDSLFKFKALGGMSFLGIGDTDPNYPAINCDNCGDFVIIHKVTVVGNVQRFLSCVTDGTATEGSVVFLEYVDTTGSTIYSILCQDTNTLGGFGSTISAENFFTLEHNNDAVIVDGPNSKFLVHAAELTGDGSGNCIRVKNGGHYDGRSTAIIDFGNGLLVDNDAGAPHILMAGMTYENCTYNINVQNLLATGNATGYTEYLKTLIPKTAPFFITGKNQQVITVGPKGADFTSVVAALAAITDNSPVNRYTISVTPGVYIETQIVLKPYVSLVGFYQTTCILLAHPSVAGTPFIIGAGYSAIDRITISVASYGFPPSFLLDFPGDPTGVHFRCDNIILDSSANLVHVGSTAGPCIFLLLNSLINMSAPFYDGIEIEDSGPNNYPIIFTLDNIIWGADAVGVSNVNEIICVKSYKSPSGGIQNIFGAITGSSLGTNFYGPAGIGFSLEGAVYVVVETCVFGGMQTALQVLPSTEPTFMILTSCTISNNVTDVDIQSTTAYGTVNINATISKVFINSSADFGVQVHDEKGALAFGGDMFQGINWNDITNISEQIQHASTTGIIDGQTSIIDAGGLNVSIGAGAGYVFYGPLASNRLKYITWAANPSFALPDNALSWLYVDSNGALNTTPTDPSNISNIILGTVKTYGGAITYIQEVGHVLNNLSSNIDEVLRDVYGPIVKSGCLASPGSSGVQRAAAVSSGEYALSVTEYDPLAGDNISMIGYYGGTVETAPFTNIPLDYDNAGVLTAIPAGKWVKHSLYILTALSGSTQYFMVYGQELFDTELAAQEGGIPLAPSTFVANMCPIAAIIVTDTDPSSPLAASRFRDIRPRLGFRSEGTTASADHNSLLNLTVGNAHPQYFRVDGTSVMTGNISLAGNNIIGSGGNLLNGVDITAHASRHLPGGADALATGVPVSIGSANAQGTASAFSRADHVHAGVSSLTGTANQISASASLGSVTLSTPSTFVAPGTLQDTTGFYQSTTAGISATGADQASATAITKSYNEVVTTPLGTGVRLPVPDKAGLEIKVVNRGVNTLLVYPHVGGAVDSLAANAPVSIPSGTIATYQASSVTQWYTTEPVLVGGAGTTVTYGNGQNTITASGVNTFSAGTTGLTPSTPTSGAIVLAGTLTAANGGTGQSSYTTGDLLYASGATTLSKLVGVATGNALISGGVSIAPSWGKIGLTTHISGTLPAINGGTGRSSYTVGDLLYADTATTLNVLASIATGNVLKSGGLSTAPSWGKVDFATDVTGILSPSNGGLGFNGGSAGNGTLAIGNGSGFTLATLSPGTGIGITNGSGSITINNAGVLSISGGSTGLTPASATTGAVTLDGTLVAANGGTGQSTYTIGDLLYASGSTTLSKLAGVATGNALISGGISSAPIWGKIGLASHTIGILLAANGGTGINASTASNGQLLIGNGSGFNLGTLTAGTGINVTNGSGAITISATNNGTVTSVGLTAPSIFSVSGSPVTSSGTLAITSNTQTANTVYAGPAGGGPGIPTFRALTSADIPSAPITYNEVTATTTSASVSGLPFIVVDSMTYTPPSGTWWVTFSSMATPTNSSSVFNAGIYRDAVQIAHSIRELSGSSANYTVQTQAIVTTTGVETITLRWQRASGSGSATMGPRSFMFLKVA